MLGFFPYYRAETWDILLFLLLLYPFFGTFVFYAKRFLPFHERRTDLVCISDRLLDALPVINTSLTVNICLYSMLLLFTFNVFFWQLVNLPVVMLSYIVLLWTRTIMITVAPFRVHPQVQVLNDIIQDFTLGDQDVFLNDLFFSGHISTLVLLGLNTDSTWQPYLYFISAIIVATCMILSKVHYTIDLLVAPYIAYCTWRMSNYIITTIKTIPLTYEIETSCFPFILISVVCTFIPLLQCGQSIKNKNRLLK